MAVGGDGGRPLTYAWTVDDAALQAIIAAMFSGPAAPTGISSLALSAAALAVVPLQTLLSFSVTARNFLHEASSASVAVLRRGAVLPTITLLPPLLAYRSSELTVSVGLALPTDPSCNITNTVAAAAFNYSWLLSPSVALPVPWPAPG